MWFEAVYDSIGICIERCGKRYGMVLETVREGVVSCIGQSGKRYGMGSSVEWLEAV